MNYCLGFMFSLEANNPESVVLIQKRKPAWQAGMLNGVGGKVEENETPLQAMAREFYEETGMNTSFSQWADAGAICGPDYAVHLFYTYDDVKKVQTTTTELVVVAPIRLLSTLNVVPNLRWIIPYLIEADRSKAHDITVTYAA